eukprot:3752543-Alexandrium_andersonii.AAC.1
MLAVVFARVVRFDLLLKVYHCGYLAHVLGKVVASALAAFSDSYVDRKVLLPSARRLVREQPAALCPGGQLLVGSRSRRAQGHT